MDEKTHWETALPYRMFVCDWMDHLLVNVETLLKKHFPGEARMNIGRTFPG